MFFTKEDEKETIDGNVDKFSDSYARDTSAAALKKVGNRPPVFLINLFLQRQGNLKAKAT